jgi:hypothetical protein
MTDPDQDTKKQAPSQEASHAATETPPKPAAPKPKAKPGHGGPATKAQQAAAKRIDKTVIKRMRKR